MNAGIKPLAEFVTEKGTDKAEGFAAVVHFVAMAEKETLAQQIGRQYVPMDHCTDFIGQVIEHPDVVVTDKNMDFDAAVR